MPLPNASSSSSELGGRSEICLIRASGTRVRQLERNRGNRLRGRERERGNKNAKNVEREKKKSRKRISSYTFKPLKATPPKICQTKASSFRTQARPRRISCILIR